MHKSLSKMAAQCSCSRLNTCWSCLAPGLGAGMLGAPPCLSVRTRCLHDHTGGQWIDSAESASSEGTSAALDRPTSQKTAAKHCRMRTVLHWRDPVKGRRHWDMWHGVSSLEQNNHLSRRVLNVPTCYNASKWVQKGRAVPIVRDHEHEVSAP